VQGTAIFIDENFITYSNSREHYVGNLSIIYGLAEIWDHVQGTLLYLHRIESINNAVNIEKLTTA
jgi:hypothetical protein